MQYISLDRLIKSKLGSRSTFVLSQHTKLAEFSIIFTMNKMIHWTQRIALVRHNLHAASRSGDFTFFKTIQAQGFVDGTNHVATLSAVLGDDADVVLSGLDDLNSGIAHMHEEAFKTVYDSLKTSLADNDKLDTLAGRSNLFVDSTMQKQMANNAIDKMTNSAIALISQQPQRAQETAANVFITGTTIIADCIEVCHKQMHVLESNMDDFIQLENSWNTVKEAVGCAITALKGVFSLMRVENNNEDRSSRAASFSLGSNTVFRRLSNAFGASTTAVSPAASSSRSSSIATGMPGSRKNSLVPEYRTPNYLRGSVSDSCPMSLPDHVFHTNLSTIPPTPAAYDDDHVNPLDTNVPPIPSLLEMHLPGLRVS